MHFCTLHIKEQMKKHEIIFILTILLLSKSWVRKKLFQRKMCWDWVGSGWGAMARFATKQYNLQQ